MFRPEANRDGTFVEAIRARRRSTRSSILMPRHRFATPGRLIAYSVGYTYLVSVARSPVLDQYLGAVQSDTFNIVTFFVALVFSLTFLLSYKGKKNIRLHKSEIPQNRK